eukprot:a678119_16.p1 GENE.a678119_16~~a678119_16.p1  ORF type:complete len:313 (-),score=76.16 a678119_16:97-1005(-)
MSDHGGDAQESRKFVAGIMGGLAVVMVGHPLDTIKTRLQLLPNTEGGGLRGAVHCLRTTMRNEGLLALYKGIRSPLSGTPPIYAISFATWGWAQKKCMELDMTSWNAHKQHKELSALGLFTAGAVSGGCQSVVWAPMELVKKRLQIQIDGKPRYTGMLDCARQIIASEGVIGLYRGYSTVLTFFIPACGFWYGSYDIYRRALNRDADHPGALRTIVAGALAGITAWGVMYPFDVVAAHIQTSDATGAERKSGLTVARQMVARHGVSALYRGIAPCLARAAVADAACFLAYELTMRAFATACD